MALTIRCVLDVRAFDNTSIGRQERGTNAKVRVFGIGKFLCCMPSAPGITGILVQEWYSMMSVPSKAPLIRRSLSEIEMDHTVADIAYFDILLLVRERHLDFL